MPVNQIKRNGSYAPLSCNYYDDDAIIAAGEKAEVLFTRGLAFCARSPLDNGIITDLQLTRVGAGLPGLKARAKRLCDVGLWRRLDGDLLDADGSGYQVVRWLKWNLSGSEIQSRQAKDSARKANGS